MYAKFPKNPITFARKNKRVRSLYHELPPVIMTEQQGALYCCSKPYRLVDALGDADEKKFPKISFHMQARILPHCYYGGNECSSLSRATAPYSRPNL